MDKDFFQVVSVNEFLELCQQFTPISSTHRQPLTSSLQKVVAKDVVANEDLPPFPRSSMDGYAVRSADTFGAGEMNPVYLYNKGTIHIDNLPEFDLRPGECAAIVTGAGLPKEADSVVMIEHTQEIGAGDVEIRRAVAPSENMMHQGEDCQAGQVQVPAGTRLRPQEISILAALGYSEVETYQPPRVAIISTGDEIIPVNETPTPGQIRDVNTYSIYSWISLAGGQPQVYGIIPDDLNQLEKVLYQAILENEMIIISGGSSVGTRDLTLEALKSLPDSKILAHGVSLSPGKPTILAQTKALPILGLPGQVTSVQIVMLVLGLPFLRHLSGERNINKNVIRSTVPANMARNVASKQGREDYIRVRLAQEGPDGLTAYPILGKSGLLKTLLQADGLVRIPAYSEGLSQAEPVNVWLI